MVASTHIESLESFYRGAFPGYLNVLFFPITALMVLGGGYAYERLDRFVGQGDGVPLPDEAALDVTRHVWEEHYRLLDGIGRGTDMFAPRSGPLRMGNPLNPINTGYIDPDTGKHR